MRAEDGDVACDPLIPRAMPRRRSFSALPSRPERALHAHVEQAGCLELTARLSGPASICRSPPSSTASKTRALASLSSPARKMSSGRTATWPSMSVPQRSYRMPSPPSLPGRSRPAPGGPAVGRSDKPVDGPVHRLGDVDQHLPHRPPPYSLTAPFASG